jgi:pyruvate,orthophosphate dikinase
VRLGVIKPGLYSMQVRALVEAAAERRKVGGKPKVEVMIPLTVTREEMALARSWVEDAIAQTEKAVGSKRGVDITIGTMVETPRAALCADEIAEVADFFSFGTNDLTQLTFGYSRDDAEGGFLLKYVEDKILAENPFQTLDEVIAAEMRMAVEKGRSTRPDLKVGICGEHGGDPASIHKCEAIGLNYVSCSPFRIPVARLAAAQAVLVNAAENDR